VRIERPPANALAPDLLAEGAEVVERLRAEAPAAVVITGSGAFFSGGVDLKLTPTLPEDEQRGMVTGINRLFCDWFGFPRPVVAAVNGHAVAGGLILALCADRRIGARGATYGLTEVRVGAPYPAAALGVVRAELEPRAVRELVLGGELIDADKALELGALDELREPAEVLDRSLSVARELAALPTATYETVKAQLRGDVLAAMLSAVAEDPLASGWLSSEMPDAARAALER
jgi:enoyl-CoA hydratase/carnithine racemase